MLGSSEFNRAGKLRKMILKKSSLVSNINRKYMKYLDASVCEYNIFTCVL